MYYSRCQKSITVYTNQWMIEMKLLLKFLSSWWLRVSDHWLVLVSVWVWNFLYIFLSTYYNILEELTLLSVLKMKRFNFWGIKKASKHLTRVLYGLYWPFTLRFSSLSPKLFLNLSTCDHAFLILHFYVSVRPR